MRNNERQKNIFICERGKKKNSGNRKIEQPSKVISNFQRQQRAKETKCRTYIKSQADGLENTAVGSHRF